ncbi:hypothetical protein HWV62_27131 [Athelia sp. TMB]|nr:hypothetical protein HWV62_27131 [Athelia sp. TMB]
MMRLMNQITEKPGWDKKVFDETIASKWKSEALSTTDQTGQPIDLTEKMFEYCISELRYKATLFENTGLVVAFDGDVVKSDSVVPEELRLSLKTAAAALENIPDSHRDWHPGSNDTVLDLVHPSLFPVVYGTTRILKHTTVDLENCVAQCGNGMVLPVPPADITGARRTFFSRNKRDPYSKKFQWLPCEVEFKSDGGVKIASYINNLHPDKNKPLYAAIEKVIDKAIILWNHTLNPLSDPNATTVRITFDGPVYGDIANIPIDQRPPQLAGEDDDAYEQRITEMAIIVPEPGVFVEPGSKEEYKAREELNAPKMEFSTGVSAGEGAGAEDALEDGGVALNWSLQRPLLNLGEKFKDRGLQVIVKLANIHLTPDKPEYAGGTWHVEGQLNEHICATALYYYDCENITESRLAFRQQSHGTEDISYAQDWHRWLHDIYGFTNADATVQYLGEVCSQEGRLLTFPNIFQHRVEPFRLADSTQPGHRKILALFLVDPHIRVISSANVPCQRRDWWQEEVERSRALPKSLPLEMKREIVGHMEDEDFPMSIEEAKKLRLELMEERKSYGGMQDRSFNGTRFSLCEH